MPRRGMPLLASLLLLGHAAASQAAGQVLLSRQQQDALLAGALGRRMLQTCQSSYTPANDRNCIYDDGGRSCTAKEVYLTSASFDSLADAATGLPLATQPCCASPGSTAVGQCYVCTPGDKLQGTLRLSVHANADRYNVGLYLAEGQHGSCGTASEAYCAGAKCKKTVLDPAQTPSLDANCCGDIRQTPRSGIQQEIIIPGYTFECPPELPTTSHCGGSAHIDYCMTWGQNAQEAVGCAATPTGASTSSYTVSGPGTPSKCFCDRNLMLTNVNVFIATCGQPAANSSARFACAAGSVFDEGTVNDVNPSQALCCVSEASRALGQPDVSIEAFSSLQNPLLVNSTVNITLVVSNDASAAADNVTLVYLVPAGVTLLTVPAGCTLSGDGLSLTCSIGTMAANSSTTLTGTSVLLGQAGEFYSNATVAAPGDVNTADNTHPIYFSVFVLGAASLPDTADIFLRTADPPPVLVASPANATLTVSNNGSAHSALDVSLLVATLPPGLTAAAATCSSGCNCTISADSQQVSCVIGTLLPDEEVTVVVVTRPLAAGNYTINVTVTASNDYSEANNDGVVRVVATAPEPSTPVLQTDVSITAAGPTQPVNVASPANYTLTVAAAADGSTATSVVVTSTLPAGITAEQATCLVAGCSCVLSNAGQTVTCSLGNMTAGATGAIVVTARPLVAGSFNLTASVAASNDADPTNNNASLVLVAAILPCPAGLYRATPTGACQACGWDWACPYNGTRTACPLHLGTASNTSSACEALACDPCANDRPDVLLNTGSGSNPPNSLWIIKAFSQSSQLVPNFLCKLGGYSSTSMVGDAALTYRGDVIVVDTVGNLRYVPGAVYRRLALQAPLTTVCNTIPLGALPRGPSYTGLTAGFRSDQLFASSATGEVVAIRLLNGAGGQLTAVATTQAKAWCDPVAKTTNTGGTDVTLGPDGHLYRFCARDASGRYGGSFFDVYEATKDLTGQNVHTDFKLADALDAQYANSGTFCTRTAVIGAGTLASTGSSAQFWRYGYGLGVTTATPVANLPAVGEFARATDTRGGANRLRVNGAAVAPKCGGQQYAHGS